jgi:hypothetical protein
VVTNREIASLVWIGILVIYLGRKPDVRSSVFAVFRVLFRSRLGVALALYAAWMVGAIYFLAQIGFWEPSMAKDTAIWAVPGIALFVGINKAWEEDGFFRRRLLEAIGLTAMLELYLNLSTLDLWVELIVQPVVTVLTLTSLVAARDPKNAQIKPWIDRIVAVIVVLILIPPALQLVAVLSNPSSIRLDEALRTVLLPVVLTAFALVPVYALSVWASYEDVILRMGMLGNRGRRVPWKAKAALISKFHIRSRALHRFAGTWPRQFAETGSFREARQVISDHEAALKAEAVERKREADALVRYAGVKGTDATGLQLDRREFKETCSALDWLHLLESAAHRTQGRYVDDVGRLITSDWDRRGLPVEHGISITTSRSGKRFFAWRRTPSGWCFAVGAGGPPPDEWYFEGPEPPVDLPGLDPAWEGHQFEPTLNWVEG